MLVAAPVRVAELVLAGYNITAMVLKPFTMVTGNYHC